MLQVITLEKLRQLTGQWLSAGKTVAGTTSVNNRLYFTTIAKPDELALNAEIMPSSSLKEFFFPRHEAVCSYRYDGKERIISDTEPLSKEQIIIGARPCDAASLPILDRVFDWDYKDRFYQQRRENSVVVTLACSKSDASCFCTSVGLSPETTNGADAELFQIDAETFEVRVYTDKGKTLFDGQTAAGEESFISVTVPPVKFDKEKIAAYLKEHFGGTAFDETSLRCVGCGACTYICPTCHCFDIVDEGGESRGQRVKNWDSCQFPLFTLHASGHNPRKSQAARQYNRIAHKFYIYPQKFGDILCTGCGNCTRVCAASLGVRPVLEKIGQAEGHQR